MHKYYNRLFFFFFIISFISSPIYSQNEFIVVSKKVSDKITGLPLQYANVYVAGTRIGTVTNSDGDFMLKTPKNIVNPVIAISFLGYKTFEMPLEKLLLMQEETISLEPAAVKLEELTIRTNNPVELLSEAYKKIGKNYSTNPIMHTGFYRETIRQNKQFANITEAVVDIYKSSYISDFDNDRIKIIRGRKNSNSKIMDTLIVKLQGGPLNTLLIDIVKNPSPLLYEEKDKMYDFTYSSINTIDGRLNYVISFIPRKDVEEAIFEGKIYIDAKDIAVSAVQFNISENKLDAASAFIIKKKPASLKVTPQEGSYYAGYRKQGNIWILQYIRSSMTLKCKSKEKMFAKTYYINSELVLTDCDTINITKFKNKESAKFGDVMSEIISGSGDENFWQDYNFIKPEELLEKAINRLNRKLKRDLM